MKQNLRKKLLEKRKFFSDAYFQMADERICMLAAELPEFQQAEVVFCYVGMEGEVSTRSLLEKVLAEGKRLGVPRCEKKGVMRVYEIRSLQDLVPGAFGIPEPVPEARLIRPEEIDLAVIPCLSCDGKGRRLGKGGGYYDRYLEGTTFLRAALCWQQMMEKEIPVDIHDQRMDVVITENDAIRTRD